MDVEENDGQGFIPVDSGGGVDVAVGDEWVEVVGEVGRDGYIEIGDDDGYSCFALMVEIFVYIYFADEVSVFADGGEQFEYSFYYC